MHELIASFYDYPGIWIVSQVAKALPIAGLSFFNAVLEKLLYCCLIKQSDCFLVLLLKLSRESAHIQVDYCRHISIDNLFMIALTATSVATYFKVIC